MNLRRKLAFFMALDRYVQVIVSGIPPLSLSKAKANSLTSVKAFGGTKLSYDIPVEYTQVDGAIKYGTYQSLGKFNTGLKITNDDVKIEVLAKAGNLEVQGDATTMGSFYCCQARAANGAAIIGISGSSTGNTIVASQYGTTITSEITRTEDHIYFIRYEYKNGTQTLYVKDLTTNTEDTQTGTYTFTAPISNFYIFGNSVESNRVNGGNAVYSCKIWDSGTLVFDSVSVKRDSDGLVSLYDKISNTLLEPVGLFEAGAITTPTPSDPMDIYCNNGALKILDKSQWTIFTNPTSVAGQGVFISSDGKWYNVNDRGAGCAIPLTIGKQYTLVIHKKTATIGTILRYGQSPQGTPTLAGIQLTDWYRGEIADGMMISFVAKQAYFVMQFSSVAVEAGMIQEAVEVLEAQGGDYTFLKYIEATGTQYIETGLSGGIRWVGSGQGTSESGGSKCILGGLATSGASVYLASRFGTSTSSSNKNWTIDGGSNSSGISGLTYVDYDITYNSIPEGSSSSSFAGTINGVSVTRTNTDEFTTWYIGAAIGAPNPTVYGFVGNIYRQQAYQNGVLVGDFIPAIRNSDNVVGMYDTVSGTFLTNAGTGTFTAGTVIGDGETLKLTPSNDTAGVANLLKINDYVDTQEILTGLINHQLGIRVFDGTEDWILSNSLRGQFYLEDTSINYSTVLTCMCSHFVGISNGESLNNYPDEDVIRAGYSGGNPTWAQRFIIQKVGTSQLSTLKSWLAAQYAAGTPVMMVFPLLTAQDEVAPVPQTMQTVAGDNTLDIVQAGMGGLEVEVKYTKA